MVHTYPEGFIPVGDAFAQALELIEDYTALRRAIDEATKDAELHEHINKYDASVRRVENLMRNALADGHLQAFTRGLNGQIEQIVDREEFRRNLLAFLASKTCRTTSRTQGQIPMAGQSFLRSATSESG